jgi:hypothetical protein
MQNLSVFDTDYNIIRDIKSDAALDVALEISAYLRNNTSDISPEAEDVLYIKNRHRRKTFVEAMLFTKGEIDTIALATGMDKGIIELYRDIFFDTSLLRGEVGLIEFYEDIFDMYDPGTPEFEYARIMREAHLGGPDIIMAQFNIQLRNYDPAAYKSRVMKLAQFKHAMTELGDSSFDELLVQTKARDAIISLTEKASKKDGAHSQSDLARLTAAIEMIADKGLGTQNEEVLMYDPATEEIIDVEEEVEEVKKIESKDE